MTEINPTLEEVDQAMAAAVAERGEDYVYPLRQLGWYHPSYEPDTEETYTDLAAMLEEDPDGFDEEVICRYVTRPEAEGGVQPACLIGGVFHRLGVPLDELAAREGNDSDAIASRFAPRLSADLRRALRSAQTRQDGGGTWGGAYAGFRKAMGLNAA